MVPITTVFESLYIFNVFIPPTLSEVGKCYYPPITNGELSCPGSCNRELAQQRTEPWSPTYPLDLPSPPCPGKSYETDGEAITLIRLHNGATHMNMSWRLWLRASQWGHFWLIILFFFFHRIISRSFKIGLYSHYLHRTAMLFQFLMRTPLYIQGTFVHSI